jgi:pyridoxal phosphate enzyme (YggS family)
MSSLADNLERVRERIAGAAGRAGRAASEITLVAVTKGAGPEVVRGLWQAGQRDFGENRVQEALPKIAAGPADARWHLIGHLQENKINKVLPLVHLIQSVHSVQLAEAIEQRAARSGRAIAILLEVKTSSEPTKLGMAPDEVDRAAAAIAKLPHVELRGLMTMAPFGAQDGELRRCFGGLRRLAERLVWDSRPVLSMGMSDDFAVAIEEGATMVRVGRALIAP